MAFPLLPVIAGGAAGLSALGNAIGRGKDRDLQRQIALEDVEFQRENRNLGLPFLGAAGDILLKGPRPERADLSGTFASRNPFARPVPALPDSLSGVRLDTRGGDLDTLIDEVLGDRARRPGSARRGLISDIVENVREGSTEDRPGEVDDTLRGIKTFFGTGKRPRRHGLP